MSKTQHKILVANRSEIACRVFQTAREMGIATCAIYAPGDEQARHLTFADEVMQVASYLDVDAVVKAAVSMGATLVHPGYGFLSERPVFARAVEKAGLIFLGPTAESMELLGGKIAAKELAHKSGVPTLPWAKVDLTDKSTASGSLKKAAKEVGFPLLLKASAGGGGKGMRIVQLESELDAAAESAAAEAKSAFGDGTLFLERYVAKPRHIEVQVFGDGLGDGVHLFERECTLQRRHQKIWEEAQAGLSEATRAGLYTAALNLVRAVKYRSAGTIEFLMDEKDAFYFLEMNTRLQVEHPVTEEVSGVDLVRAQIEQALSPKKAVLKQLESSRGHAIEVRVYAEDAYQGFIPTPGRVERLRWPMGAGIRVESGIEEGQEVGTSFDSMLGKIIVRAETRAHAIERMRVALEDTVILGMGTNLSYLHALSLSPAVKAGKVYTGFLEKEFGAEAPQPTDGERALLVNLKKAGAAQSMASSGGASTSSGSSQYESPLSKYSEVIRGN